MSLMRTYHVLSQPLRGNTSRSKTDFLGFILISWSDLCPPDSLSGTRGGWSLRLCWCPADWKCIPLSQLHHSKMRHNQKGDVIIRGSIFIIWRRYTYTISKHSLTLLSPSMVITVPITSSISLAEMVPCFKSLVIINSDLFSLSHLTCPCHTV